MHSYRVGVAKSMAMVLPNAAIKRWESPIRFLNFITNTTTVMENWNQSNKMNSAVSSASRIQVKLRIWCAAAYLCHSMMIKKWVWTCNVWDRITILSSSFVSDADFHSCTFIVVVSRLRDAIAICVGAPASTIRTGVFKLSARKYQHFVVSRISRGTGWVVGDAWTESGWNSGGRLADPHLDYSLRS